MHRSKRRCDEKAVQQLRAASAHHGSNPLYAVGDTVSECTKDEPTPASSCPPFSPTILDSLEQIGIIELLDQDLRPTFILDLEDLESLENGVLRPVYCNPMLDTTRGLQDLVLGKSRILVDGDRLDGGSDEAYKEFVSWAFQPLTAQARDASLLNLVLNGICWITSTLRSRWRVVAGNNYALLPENKPNAHTPSFLGHKRVKIHDSYSDRGLNIDGLSKMRESQFGSEAYWKVSAQYPSVSAHLQLVLDTNWAATSFGAMETWSPQLNHLCNMLFAEPIPSILFWGNENFLMYNETYAQFLGDKHPSAMGSTAEATLPEVWDMLSKMLEKGKRDSEPIKVNALSFFLERKGFSEETYFDSTFLPLIGEDGSVLGFHESVLEVTSQVFSARRRKTLEQLDERMCQTHNINEFWKEAARVMEQNVEDMPLTLCYSFNPAVDGSSQTFSLESHSGLMLDILTSKQGIDSLHRLFLMCSQSSKDSRRLLIIKEAGLPKLTGGNIDVETIVVSPIPFTATTETARLIIIGLSPRQVYDENYQAFIDSFLSKLDASFLATSARQREQKEKEEREEAQRRSDLEKARLAKALELETKRFERSTESAPVGVWVSDTDGKFMFRNAEWYKITGHPRDENIEFSWMDIVHEDHQTKLREIWKTIAEQRKTEQFELKLKRLWDGVGCQEISAGAGLQNAWVLCSSHPDEIFDDGRVKSFVGCVAEISRLKWAEGEETRRKDEALKAKRQQEAFVDMVSHEIRNPLAAIIQSADGIIASLESSDELSKCQQDIVNSAEVIVVCAQHQKRIVDDILSMSKLDSDLLDITPVSAKPIAIAQQAFTILNSEAKSAEVSMSLSLEPSYHQLGIDHVYLDPSRLTQVLINLITNAIKFTRFQPKRSVTVTVGASLSKPCFEESSEQIIYVRAKSSQHDLVSGTDWGKGETLFITFSVQDTGRGLNDEEKKVLFQRFSQASPKTHVQYGGSGLGLYISRTLVEKQGGEIGVASESGVGSTFAFFIKVRKVINPDSTMISEQQSTNGATKHRFNENETEQQIQQDPRSTSLTSKSRETSSKLNFEPLHLHILLTEDNLINQTVLRNQLLPYCQHVSLANHGLEALTFLRSSIYWTGQAQTGKKVDVILMDQEMPQMDGLTCVKRIRELEKEGLLVGHVPVIAITANARKKQIEMLLEAGMDDVLLKPFRLGELLGKIKLVIGNGVQGLEMNEGEADSVG